MILSAVNWDWGEFVMLTSCVQQCSTVECRRGRWVLMINRWVRPPSHWRPCIILKAQFRRRCPQGPLTQWVPSPRLRPRKTLLHTRAGSWLCLTWFSVWHTHTPSIATRPRTRWLHSPRNQHHWYDSAPIAVKIPVLLFCSDCVNICWAKWLKFAAFSLVLDGIWKLVTNLSSILGWRMSAAFNCVVMMMKMMMVVLDGLSWSDYGVLEF